MNKQQLEEIRENGKPGEKTAAANILGWREEEQVSKCQGMLAAIEGATYENAPKILRLHLTKRAWTTYQNQKRATYSLFLDSLRVVVWEWRTEAMSAPSFHYYHKSCYTEAGLVLAPIREIFTPDVSLSAKCSNCGEFIRKEVKRG